MSDKQARALARSLFGTDDDELMTVQQLLDWKVLQRLLRNARAEGLEEAAMVAQTFNKGHDISWWMSATKQDVAMQICLDIAESLRAQANQLKETP